MKTPTAPHRRMRALHKGLMASILALTLHAPMIGATQHDDITANANDEAQRFVSVMMQIKQYYIQPVDDHTLFTNAIRGMVTRLDPHSSFLDASDLKRLNRATSGRFAGIGIEMVPENGLIKVVTPLDDSPAMDAGLAPGDYIIRVDDTMVEGMPLNEIVEKIRGPKGSIVKLTILRQGQKPFEVNVKRDVIHSKNIKAQLYDQHYAYVRIAQFQANTAEQLAKALRKLQKQSHNQLQALILDLRNNPGGLLHSAVGVSDLFLDSERLGKNTLIVYAKDRQGDISLREKASEGDWLNGMPIIVLMNAGSASASEIVAGALQDHHRATIMGTRSFGKGSVQTVIPISQESAVKLTTHLYYTPSGHRIQAQGITPNVMVKDVKLIPPTQTHRVAPITEAQLKGHLKNGDQRKQTQSVQLQTAHGKLAYQDYQLHQAINLAKGLTIAHRSTAKHGKVCAPEQK